MSHSIRMTCGAVAATLVFGALGGCAAPPLGPSIAVMPAAGMPYDQFQSIDASCRAAAEQRSARYAGNANDSALASGAAGALVGAAAGALIGGNSRGAGVGAGVGLLAGSMGGSGVYSQSQSDAQRAYDRVYAQCMYAKGAQVPGYAPPVYVAPPGTRVPQPPPSGYAPPPPPPGYAPPPPPPPPDYAPAPPPQP